MFHWSAVIQLAAIGLFLIFAYLSFTRRGKRIANAGKEHWDRLFPKAAKTTNQTSNQILSVLHRYRISIQILVVILCLSIISSRLYVLLEGMDMFTRLGLDACFFIYPISIKATLISCPVTLAVFLLQDTYDKKWFFWISAALSIVVTAFPLLLIVGYVVAIIIDVLFFGGYLRL